MLKQRSIPWQYFSIDLTEPERKALFNLDTCENCNRLVLAANSVWGFDSREKYLRLGMMEMSWEHYVTLSEISYSEKLDCAICQECCEE